MQSEEEIIKEAIQQHSKGTIEKGRKNSYLCTLCPKAYTCNRSLQQHYKSVHSIKPFTCDICRKSFYTQEDIDVHMTKHGIGEKQYKCHICDKKLGQRRSLIRHLKLHSGGKTYTCKHCDINFIDYKAFKRHHLKHSLETYRSKLLKSKSLAENKENKLKQKKALPKDGQEKDKNEENVERSVEKSNDTNSNSSVSENLFTCDICNKTFANKKNLDQHSQIHMEVPSHTCDQCSKSFTSLNKLEKHKAAGHDQVEHRCNVCRKNIKNEETLKEHMKTCGSYKPKVSCSVCEEKFSTIYQLETHKKIKHNKENSDFVCETCGESFKQKFLLTRHKKLLCNRETAGEDIDMEPMFKCNDCGMQFEDAAGVAKHIEDKGPDSLPYQCSKCCKRFATQRTLKRHEDSHESELFKCEFCEKTFVTVGGLEQHMDSEPHFKFVCGTCRKRFGTSKELKTHSKIHG